MRPRTLALLALALTAAATPAAAALLAPPGAHVPLLSGTGVEPRGAGVEVMGLDLVVGGFTTRGSLSGTEFRYSIQNVGTGTTAPSLARACLQSASGSQTCSDVRVPELGPDGAFEGVVKAPNTALALRLCVTADVAGSVPEVHEENNEGCSGLAIPGVT